MKIINIDEDINNMIDSYSSYINNINISKTHIGTIILYYCSADDNFIPIWKRLKRTLWNQGLLFEEYEADRDFQVMYRDGIIEYPTIRMRGSFGIIEHMTSKTYNEILKQIRYTFFRD
jgi:hypothetical protein